MPNDRTDSTSLFNPFLAWADLGMRAAEMTLASSQNINDAADRVARAGAAADSAGLAIPGFAQRGELPPALRQLDDLQRTVLDWFTEGWVRWMSALGTFAALPAGAGLARTVAHQGNPLEAVRTSLWPAAGEGQAAHRPAASAGSGPQRRRADAASDLQHALAAAESKPRRKRAAKRKGARRTARK